MLELLKVIILGIIEGVTEWLPISSTGHMILADEFIKLDVSKDYMDMFLVVIQLGAILAVVVIFWQKIWPFCNRKRIDKSSMSTGSYLMERYIQKDKWTLWFKILVSCLPAIIIGVPLDDWITAHFYNYQVVALMLIIYGVLFIVIENYNKRRKPSIRTLEDITWTTALFIGIFQVLALIPGTSRSGATIIGGILVGCSRKIASEYTFFLAIPVMFGASLLKVIKFMKLGLAVSAWEVMILVIGMLVAFVVSIFVIKFLMSYIKKHDFKVFGWYRIVLGIVVLAYFMIKTLIV